MIERIPQLRNREFEPTYLENGTKCPVYDHVVNEQLVPGRTQCDNCSLCKQQVIQSTSKKSCGVMCMYRKDPPFDPLYKVGDEKWYLYTYSCPARKKIRKVEWSPRRGCWEYTFSREQHTNEESHVFNTLKECEEYILLYKASHFLRDLQEHHERFGSLPESLKTLLSPAEGKKLLLSAGDNS